MTSDNTGQVRPLKSPTFASPSEAEEENARSRLHRSFDASEGATQGQQVAEYVFDNAFTALKLRH